MAITLWPLTSHDGGLGAAVVAAISAVGMMLLIVWVGSWPPLVRAEQANLALAGGGVPPRRREPLRRPVACFVAFLIACVLYLLLQVVGVNLGPLGIAGLLLLALACWRSMLPF